MNLPPLASHFGFLFVLLIYLGILSVEQPLAEEPHSKPVTDPTTGLSFVLPPTFHITRYKDNPQLAPAQRAAIPRVIVLAEERIHPSRSPIGIGSLPVISLDVLTGARATFNQVFLKPEFRKTIGHRTVYELPAHQGPLAQQVFYYLVPLGPDRIVEIAGHRYYFTPGQTVGNAAATAYDRVIADIISSLSHNTL